MPVMDGIELTKRIADKDRSIVLLHNEYVKQWGHSMFGPDPDQARGDTQLAKSILRLPD
jgi:hypothetical protein